METHLAQIQIYYNKTIYILITRKNIMTYLNSHLEQIAWEFKL